MKPEPRTGWDLAFRAKAKGATISPWRDPDGKVVAVEIIAPKGGGSVVVPTGTMRPSMWGFVVRVLRALLLLAIAAGGYAVAIRLP